MGGEGPYVQFDKQCSARRETSVNAMDDQQLEDAYTRAHGFLLEKTRQLTELGWKQQDMDDSLLVSLDQTCTRTMYYGSERCLHRQLRLPRSVNAFFEPSSSQNWKTMFEAHYLFDARRRRGYSSNDSDRYRDYLYPDVEDPLRDIFYLLQCLIPGMLVIIRVDEIDDIGEEEYTQILPPSNWVEDFSKDICPILGEERLKEVKQAPKCLSHTVSSFLVDDEPDELLDLTACDKECGYCGKCEY